MNKVKNINELEEELSNNSLGDEDVSIPEIYTLSYEVKSCADLFRMHKSGQLQIQPEFQRNFVWKPQVQTRFIDSLIRKLPIPSLFMGLDSKTEKYIIIDGLQRISTIIKFFDNPKWRMTRLPDIDERILGKKVEDIKEKTPELYSRVENLAIPVIIIRYDFSKQDSVDYLFTIFHRLNTGGQKLNNQEIRNCIYSSNFNNVLKSIAQSDEWENTMGKSSKIDRLESEELILRVFAFMDKLDEYTGNLSKFLNHYMAEKKNAGDDEIGEKKDLLLSALSIIEDEIEAPNEIGKMGRTVKEALLVGIINNITYLNDCTPAKIKDMFHTFINDDEFQEENLKSALAQKDKVQTRLRKSIVIFSE